MSTIPYDTARVYTGEKPDDAERLMWDNRMPPAFARKLASLLKGKRKPHPKQKEQADEDNHQSTYLAASSEVCCSPGEVALRGAYPFFAPRGGVYTPSARIT